MIISYSITWAHPALVNPINVTPNNKDIIEQLAQQLYVDVNEINYLACNDTIQNSYNTDVDQLIKEAQDNVAFIARVCLVSAYPEKCANPNYPLSFPNEILGLANGIDAYNNSRDKQHKSSLNTMICESSGQVTFNLAAFLHSH